MLRGAIIICVHATPTVEQEGKKHQQKKDE
jgi:hypothetical protein